MHTLAQPSANAEPPARSFWPSTPGFWLLHAGVCALAFGLTLLTAGLWSRHPGYDLASSLVWLWVFTLAMLTFRWLYRRQHWQRHGVLRLVLLALWYSASAGLAIATLVSLSVLPFFWSSLWPAPAPAPLSRPALALLGEVIVRNALQTQLFVGGWIFIYIGVTNARRAKDSELLNLRLENRLKHSALENLRLEHSLREAQLLSLSDQLNPHFLFNALNNLRFMVHEDAARAEAMVVALSAILRYSLERSRHRTVPLREELLVVEQYLYLMRTQLEARLDVALQLAPGLEDCRIPPMLIQLLVENAIKHGVERLPDGGRLRVQIEECAAQLQIVVSNDRPPQDKAPHGAGGAGLGLGLGNIEQRLQLLYGAHSTLSVHAEPGGFRVEVRLPKEWE